MVGGVPSHFVQWGCLPFFDGEMLAWDEDGRTSGSCAMALGWEMGGG